MRTHEEIDRLVTDNMQLAHYMASKWERTLGPDEALSICMEALLEAAQTYDAGHGRFGTWAGIRMKWLLNYRHKIKNRKKRGAGIPDLSLDAHMGGHENSIQWVEHLKDESAPCPRQQLDDAEEHARVRRHLRAMPPRVQDILAARFRLDGRDRLTLEQLAQKYQITRERIRQCEQDGLQHLAIAMGRQPKKYRACCKRKRGHLWSPPVEANDLFRPEHAQAGRLTVRRIRRAA